MSKQQGKLYIGTSGWVYDHWKGIFYPQNLSSKDKLKYFSKHFRTVEVNYSFYHLPRLSTCKNWYNQTQKDFIFTVKASRFITHIKRLRGIRAAWRIFLKNTINLKEKLGPILFQFPSNFRGTQENIKRLENFLKFITSLRLGNEFTMVNSLPLRFTFEFRHTSWCDKKIYNLLKKYKTAWVIADSPRYPKIEVVTTDFIYIRMHGSKILFSSKYTKNELKNLARKIKNWLKQELDVYVYFNNDACGFAVENAKELLKFCLSGEK